MEARNRFARRLLKLLHNGLRWRTYARGILLHPSEGAAGGSSPLEQTLAVELVGKVLLPILEAGWETGCREIAVKVRGFCSLFFAGERKARLNFVVCFRTLGPGSVCCST
jgi:hypothetical protein